MPSFPLAILSTLSLVVAGARPEDPKPDPTSIRVQDTTSGCYARTERVYAWKATGTGYACEFGSVTTAQVDRLRATILEAPDDRADLLQRVGITPVTVAAHRSTILDVAWPRALPRPNPLELPPELAHLLEFERLAPHVRAELLGRNWDSTSQRRLEIEIPGDPPIRITSTGLVPHMLPWTIEVRGQQRESNDVEISRAVLIVLDPKGPNRAHVDGATYWRDEFWSADMFWRRFVADEIDAALSAEAYAKLAGYREALEIFRIDRVQTGSINMQPDSLFVQLTALRPSAIDGAWWWSPLADGKPSADWNALLGVHRRATRAVQAHPWLLEWKTSAPDRTLDMHAVGDVGYSESMIDAFVEPPWKHAGLAGAPEFEILLRRKGDWCGTVWLSSADPAALIETAQPGPRTHWFDALDFSFHPTEPDYGVVDGAGNFHARRIPK